jgi:uncharacterized protein with PIN domain
MVQALGPLIFMLIVTAFVFAIYAVFIKRCPKCKRFFAVKPTAEKRPQKGRAGEKFPGVGERLWRCEYCGYEKWRAYTTRWQG